MKLRLEWNDNKSNRFTRQASIQTSKHTSPHVANMTCFFFNLWFLKNIYLQVIPKDGFTFYEIHLSHSLRTIFGQKAWPACGRVQGPQTNPHDTEGFRRRWSLMSMTTSWPWSMWPSVKCAYSCPTRSLLHWPLTFNLHAFHNQSKRKPHYHLTWLTNVSRRCRHVTTWCVLTGCEDMKPHSWLMQLW